MEKKVILYTRVSTAEQADNGFSLQYQKKALEQYCQIKKYDVVQHFEEDYSAKTFDRPKWKTLMEYVKLNKANVDLVLCLKWDRFSRNQTNALVTIRELRDKYGIEVNTSEQPLDLTQSESKILLSIYLATPEIENDKNSQRTTDGSRQARIEGCWTGTAPFGYSNHRDAAGKSTLIPNENAAIVQKIYSEFATGTYSAEQLRKQYWSHGIKLAKMTFLSILRNIAYTGRIHIKAYGKYEAYEVEGLHEPLIDEKLFYQVQRIFNGRRRTKTTPHSQSVEELPLRGVLQCKVCGGNLTGSKSKGSTKSYFYYHCNDNSCKERFRADLANKAFKDHLSAYCFPEEVVELYGCILEDIYKEQSQDEEAKLKSVQLQIEKQTSNIEKLQDLLINESITDVDYKAMKQRYNGMLNELVMKYTEVSISQKSSIKQLRFGVSFLKNLSACYEKSSLDSKRRIISSIFPEKLQFHNGEYRTDRINEVVSLLALNFNHLDTIKTKNADDNASVYFKAPPPRLERGTL